MSYPILPSESFNNSDLLTIFRGQEPLLQAVGPGMLMLMLSLTLVVLASVLGWWGFA